MTNQTIWKYTIAIADEVDVALPAGAQILCVGTQFEDVCLWALVDPSADAEPRRIKIRGTGHDASGVGRYLGTFQLHGGSLVFHAFEAEQ